MKINKSKILNDLQADLRASERDKKEWDQRRIEYRRETAGEPYGNEVEGRSRIVTKEIKKTLSWLIPAISDPFLSTNDVIKCTPITSEDEEAARQNELLLNTQFCRKFPRYNFINKATKVLAVDGTLVVQTGWDYQEEVVEEEVEMVAVSEDGHETIVSEIQEVVKVIKNQPTAIVCRNQDIFVDPTCLDNIDKCQFVIHRSEKSLSDLKADGRYKNLDKVAYECVQDEGDYLPEDRTYFKFEDAARKKVLVHEYWGNYDIDGDGIAEPIVCTWVGKTIIRLEENPYPDKKIPFIIVPFNSIPFQLDGESLAEDIGDNQKVKTAITRGIIDNMARSNNGQIGMRHGALNMANRKKFLQGKNFEFNGTPADFWQGSFNQIPSSAFDMIGLQNNEIESQTGVKSFSGGINASGLGSTATGARATMDAASVRRQHIIRNISENLMKPLLRKWMAYNAEFLEDEEVIRVTNNKFVPVRRDDLAGRIDIDLTISTYEENSAKAQELSFLLQTLGNSVPFELTQKVLTEIVRLGKMPALEKQLREFKPQQDPLAEKAKQLELQNLQLENAKLQAEIGNLNARAGENEVDKELKSWKAKVEEAKARKLESEADLSDLEMIRKDHGFQHLENMERERLKLDYQAKIKELDRQANLEAMLFQANLGDSDIGVLR